MSRESRIFFSRLIVAGIFAISIIAAVVAHFLVTLISVATGILIWLLYLLSAGLGTDEAGGDSRATIGRNISKVLAGLGTVLALSAFNTYGIEQTMFGSYLFNMQGLAIAMLILLISISPLVILQLTSSPGSRPPQIITELPEPLKTQPFYQAPQQPQVPYDDEGEYFDEDEEDIDDDEEDEWDEDEEEDEEDEN